MYDAKRSTEVASGVSHGVKPGRAAGKGTNPMHLSNWVYRADALRK